MAAALLPPKGWVAIKRACEAGVSVPTLAKKYNVPEVTIRKRKSREKWITPERLEEERAIAELARSSKKVASGAMSRMSQDLQNEGGMGHVVEEIASLAEAGSLHFARLAGNALKKTKSLKIKSVGDAVSAVKGLRSVAGLDRESAISVNIGSWSAGSMRTVGGDLYDP